METGALTADYTAPRFYFIQTYDCKQKIHTGFFNIPITVSILQISKRMPPNRSYLIQFAHNGEPSDSALLCLVKQIDQLATIFLSIIS